jgi:hypothetical protein
LAVWDSFHANEIEISFPQRDLHIKDAVPFKILKESPQSVAKDSMEIDSDKERAADCFSFIGIGIKINYCILKYPPNATVSM